jgi:hypothetical protein
MFKIVYNTHTYNTVGTEAGVSMTIRERLFKEKVIAIHHIYDYELQTKPLFPGRQFIKVHGGSFKGKLFEIEGRMSGSGHIRVTLLERQFLMFEWVKYAATRGGSKFSLREGTPGEHLPEAQFIGNITNPFM